MSETRTEVIYIRVNKREKRAFKMLAESRRREMAELARIILVKAAEKEGFTV